jgi:flagellar protein FlaG
MAGNAASELIFFIAAIMISSVVAVTLIDVVGEYSDNIEDEASLLKWDMKAKVKVINDPMYVPYDTSDGNLTIYVKNTGTSDLSVDEIVIGANGTARADTEIWVSIVSGGSKWSPGETVKVNFRVPNLEEDIDYHGWVSTNGLTSSGVRSGSAEDSFVFRIMEV